MDSNRYKGLKIYAPPRLHEGVMDYIAELLDPDARILELGAGTGAFSRRLKDNGYNNIIASGIEPGIYELKDVPYIFLDLNQPLAPEHHAAYDAVVAIEVVEHVENVFGFFRKVALMLKAGGLAFITTPNIFSVMSRLMFIHSGNLLWFNPIEVDRTGHIQILPPWLLEMSAERAKLHSLKKVGLSDVSHNLHWRHKIINTTAIFLKKCLYKEKFPGEFSKMNLLMILKKSEQ
jgi:2-polyprenyl-3-methyl-5-hydroxy-6-metoxy-1,4-benzoquinol methylase